MITNEVISEIYKKYNKRPSSIDCLDLALLFEKVGIMHDIMIDPDTSTLTIGSMLPDSPFHEISLKNLFGIVPFEQWTAIVMHSSIIFLNNKKPISSIHIKEPSLTLWDRIKGLKDK